MRKPRSTGKLFNLPDSTRNQLDTWLFVENLGYYDVQERLQRLFKVKVSTGRLSSYYHKVASTKVFGSKTTSIDYKPLTIKANIDQPGEVEIVISKAKKST